MRPHGGNLEAGEGLREIVTCGEGRQEGRGRCCNKSKFHYSWRLSIVFVANYGSNVYALIDALDTQPSCNARVSNNLERCDA